MKQRIPFSTTLWIILLVWSVLYPAPTRAEQTVFIPKIMVQTTYDDNVLFKDTGDLELRLTPSMKLKYRAEDWELTGGGKAVLFRYEDLTEYDRENYDIWFKGSKELNERFQLKLDASYDYNHTFVEELAQSGTQSTTSLRRRYSMSPGISWNVSEKDRLSITIPLSATRYAGKTNPDSTERGSLVTWSHGLNNQRTALLAQGSYNHYDYDRTNGDTRQDVYNLMGGFSYRPTELLEFVGYGGLGYANSIATVDGGTDKTASDIYPSFDISGTYAREKWKFTLGADRMISPSIYGESTTRARVRASSEYAFTERLTASFEGAFYTLETEGLVAETEKQTFSLRPTIQYKWTKDAVIRLEYKHTSIENRISHNTDQQNRIALRFEYSYPTFF
ncbi:porin family protein [Pseudodesulfovibrio piezophilus]|nr:DUF481 domain-containing protein [Pseudodesulfovibrio piezophilus]